MINILLPVHNGAIFLEEMFFSIKQQTCEDIVLLTYDDASQDKSSQIISSFNEKSKTPVQLFANSKIPVKPLKAFNFLLRKSTAEYVCFADQDDVWFSDKTEKSFKKIKEAENIYGEKMPLLVYSDMMVVDKGLSIINDSYYKYQKINPFNCSLNRLLLQNVSSGCTIMANRALVDLAGEVPEQAVMHDHWFSLVASAFGKIIYLDEPTLYYRQHDNNFYGASSYGWNYFHKQYKLGIDKVKERFYQNVQQAQAFLQRYRHMLPDETIKLLDDFSELENQNWLARRKTLIKHKIYKSGWRRNIGTMLII